MKLPEMMNAVVLEAPEQLIYKQIPMPALQPGWVLMKVGAVSVCGSDVLRVWHNHARVMPIVLGHECAGTIAAVGPDLDESLIGRNVALIPLIPNMESPISDMGFYSSSSGYSFIGSRINGAYAEYVALPAANAIQMPPDVPAEIGALLEPCTVGHHALNRGGGVEGRTVAVFGAGSIGLFTIQIAHALGAKMIIAVDINDEHLESAVHFGADVTVNPSKVDTVEAIMDATTYGADLSLEVAGLPVTLEQAVLSTRAGGDLVLVGNQPVKKQFSLNLIEQFMRRQLNMHGCWMSYSAPFPGMEWQNCLSLMQAGKLSLSEMITHRISLKDLPDTFEKIRQGAMEYRKIMVTP